MADTVESQGVRLTAHIARPPAGQEAPGGPGLVVCSGFPSAGGRDDSAETYPQLADRLAAEAGWTVLTFSFRGTGGSDGDFSLAGWLADLHAAADHLGAREGVERVWLAGSSTGGSLAICAAGEDDRIAGVAALSARADFDDWASEPQRFLQHARDMGVIRSPGYPEDLDAWARELTEVRPLAMAKELAPRPLLLVHGADDDAVPATDVRAIADFHGSAELRIINGAGHRLRHDPRAIAVLLGWMERQATGSL